MSELSVGRALLGHLVADQQAQELDRLFAERDRLAAEVARLDANNAALVAELKRLRADKAELVEGLRRIAFEPIDGAEASAQQVLNGCEAIARALIAKHGSGQ